VIGISHRCAPGGRSIESFLSECREIDFAGIEHLCSPLPGPAQPTPQFYRQTGLALLAVRCDADPEQAQLAADFDSGPATAARSRVLRLFEAARQLGCRQVLIDPGAIEFSGAEELALRVAQGDAEAREALAQKRATCRDRFLENLCRNLHQLLTVEPELQLALAPSACPLTLPLPEDLALLLAELPGGRLGYWHAPDVAAEHERLGLTEAGSWLDAGRQRMVGCYLSDNRDGTLGQLPGSGAVDWKALREYLRPADVKILRVAPGATRQELVATRQFLQGLGWS